MPIEIPVVLHDDYHFIIKKLTNELEEKFECLKENTEKYKTFSVPIEKEVTKINSYLINMLLIVENGITGGLCHAIHGYEKANNKHKKDYNKIKESLYLNNWDINNLYGSLMSQKLPVNNFEWIKDTSQLNEDFTKTMMKKVMKDIFLKLIFNILKSNMKFIMIYHFFLKE